VRVRPSECPLSVTPVSDRPVRRPPAGSDRDAGEDAGGPAGQEAAFREACAQRAKDLPEVSGKILRRLRSF